MREFRDNLYTKAGLENLAENLVLQELYDFSKKIEQTQNSEFCVCSICLADVAAIVLNDLKPYYCSNFIDKDKNSDYFSKYKSEVQQKILKAFEMVKKNPHHEK
ncbi:late competence development ComFB family protein [Acetivibrio cellulolyticus]|uniref:late competence development ComFB family protein n=1 Tax=Acetivibrio cellulolyticus TaxID=35830 RepID=UPI0001E2D42E|nr:late competence development ComFB family protein [Acetivibrio cellulolyticus]